VPILAAPPLATQIADAFGLGEAGTGALTTLPMIAVAFGAIPAAWFIARFRLKSVIVSGLLILAIASMARGMVPSSLMLFAVSLVMGLGVALFQTALPRATTVWTPSHVALASAVYINGMMMGEMVGAGFTLPVMMPIAGNDWRVALGLWSVPVILIAMPLLASFVVLAAPKWVGLRAPVAVSAIVSVIGMVVFVFFHGWASWAAALLVGFASTVTLVLLMSLPPSIAQGNAVTRLTAGMTLIGFSLTFVLVFIGGWLADLSNWIEMAFVPSILFMLLALAALGRSERYPNYE